VKTLTDEIVAICGELVTPYSKGLLVREIAKHIGCAEARVRDAFDEIKASERAIIVRHPGEKARRVVPCGHDFGFPRATVCKNCDVLFERAPKSVALNCSIQCKNSWTWKNPETRAKRLAGIRAERATPEAKARLAEHNKRRWSKPGEREKLSEQNRREWADPVKRAKRSAGIQAANGTAEMRKKYSDRKKEQWRDADYRDHISTAVREANQTAYCRAKASENMKEKWRNPQSRARYMAGQKKRAEKGAAANRGRKLSPEHRAKIGAATRARHQRSKGE